MSKARDAIKPVTVIMVGEINAVQIRFVIQQAADAKVNARKPSRYRRVHGGVMKLLKIWTYASGINEEDEAAMKPTEKIRWELALCLINLANRGNITRRDAETALNDYFNRLETIREAKYENRSTS